MKKGLQWRLAVCIFLMALAVTMVGGQTVVSNAETSQPIVQYQVHVQKKGWTNSVTQGVAGTTGQGLRLEAIRISVSGVEGLGVQYQTHVQTYGWQNIVCDGADAGTTGLSKRLEAIRIWLTGAQAENYDIYYRVHAQTCGWMNWAKNGESAGTQSYGKRLEAIEIRILPKGSEAPDGGSGVAFAERKAIEMTAHVQSYGWMSEVDAGSGFVLGTTGKSKRIEAIKLNPVGYDLNVEYSVHVQTYGWSSYVKNGQTAGTTGQGKRLEAVKIRLTGNDADAYDIYYRAHVQGFGWLDWAKNDEIAGTGNLSLRMEALEVRLVKKGDPAPGCTERACVTNMPRISYRAYVQNQGWQNTVSDGTTAGTTGRGLAVQAMKIETTGDEKVGVEYSVYQNGSWTAFASDGAQTGTPGSPVTAVRVRLIGADANAYKVYYRVHSQTYGWLGWAENGGIAGTTRTGKSVQAIEIVIKSKAQSAPGSSLNANVEAPMAGSLVWPVDGDYKVTSPFGHRSGAGAGASSDHKGIDIDAATGTHILAAAAGTVTKAECTTLQGNIVEISHGSFTTLYMHNSALLVHVGDTVYAGQPIALAGSTGVSTAPHCHFGISVNGEKVDPAPYLGIPSGTTGNMIGYIRR